jgi:hypothetical protein
MGKLTWGAFLLALLTGACTATSAYFQTADGGADPNRNGDERGEAPASSTVEGPSDDDSGNDAGAYVDASDADATSATKDADTVATADADADSEPIVDSGPSVPVKKYTVTIEFMAPAPAYLEAWDLADESNYGIAGTKKDGRNSFTMSKQFPDGTKFQIRTRCWHALNPDIEYATDPEVYSGTIPGGGIIKYVRCWDANANSN